MSYRHKHIKTKIHKLTPKKSFYEKPYFWFALIFVAVISSFIYFLIFFPKIQVNFIEISGNEKIESKNIENTVATAIEKKFFNLGGFSLASKSIFLVDLDDLNARLTSRFPEIETLSVNKKLPQTLVLEIKERKPFAVFCKSGQGMPPEDCYFIDTAGVIFEALPAVPEGMAIVRQTVNESVFVGENAIAQNIMSAISRISDSLKNNFQIDISEALISTPVRLDIKTAESWQIYFNLDSDVNSQITKLNLILKEEIPADSRKNLQYIDLRFRDKTYYK